MENHPLGNLMETTMKRIREMIDVNIIVGDPIQTPDGVTLIPASKVTYAFTAGGAEYSSKNKQQGDPSSFGGGSGAGVTITPIAFVVVRGDETKLISLTQPETSSVDRLIESAPGIVEKIISLIKKHKKDKDVVDDDEIDF